MSAASLRWLRSYLESLGESTEAPGNASLVSLCAKASRPVCRVRPVRRVRPVFGSIARLSIRRLAAEKSPYLIPWSERSGGSRRGLRPSVWLNFLIPLAALPLCVTFQSNPLPLCLCGKQNPRAAFLRFLRLSSPSRPCVSRIRDSRGGFHCLNEQGTRLFAEGAVDEAQDAVAASGDVLGMGHHHERGRYGGEVAGQIEEQIENLAAGCGV